jgi:hypothetical protein
VLVGFEPDLRTPGLEMKLQKSKSTYRVPTSSTVIVVRSQVRALPVARRLARVGANTGAR